MGATLGCAKRRGHEPNTLEAAVQTEHHKTNEDSKPLGQNVEAWAKLARGARRLARMRRLWAVLGHWLREVKQRGR